MAPVKKKKVKTDDLGKLYYNLGTPAGYASQAKLSSAATNLPGKTVKDWLASQHTYSLNKPARRGGFPLRSYKVSGPNVIWQLDLLEMIPYAKVNNGFRYILTCIDVFTRFARARPLSNKEGGTVAKAMEDMFVDAVPHKIQTDSGKEFYNSIVKSLLQKSGVKVHYSVYSKHKAAIVERFNRTLRDKLKRYFTRTGKKVWYDVLQTIIDTYNNTSHRGILNMKPSQVDGDRLWNAKMTNTPAPKRGLLSVGSYVRISRASKTPFILNFDHNWSDEVFQIVEVDSRDTPAMYTIQDDGGERVDGKFYKEELQVLPGRPDVYRVEKVIKRSGNRYFVKWYGYGPEHNSWVTDLYRGV